MPKAVKTGIGRFFIFETIMALGAALAISLLWNANLGFAFFLGALCVIIPGMLFAKCAFSYVGARFPQKTLRNFFIGEVLKFLMVAILFYIAIKIVPEHAGALCAGFIVTQLLVFTMPLFLNDWVSIK